MRDCKFSEGDIVDFNMKDDDRYDRWLIVQCEILEAHYLGYYDLKEIGRVEKLWEISCSHHLVPERCLSFSLNPHID